MARRRLPDEVQVLGVTVTVQTVSRKELDALGGCGAYACWIVDHRTVYVLRSLSWPKKVEAFLHELEHAFTDYKSWMRELMLKG